MHRHRGRGTAAGEQLVLLPTLDDDATSDDATSDDATSDDATSDDATSDDATSDDATQGSTERRRKRTTLPTPLPATGKQRQHDADRVLVPLAAIDQPSHHLRKDLEPRALQKLANSIDRHGLLQAPLLRPRQEQPDRYIVVFGHRRVEAHRLLGRDAIEALVRDMDDVTSYILACVETVQRRRPTRQEEMDMIGVLLDMLGTQEAIADALQVSPSWISKRRRILGSPAATAAVVAKDISVETGYNIVSASTSEDEVERMIKEPHVRTVTGKAPVPIAVEDYTAVDAHGALEESVTIQATPMTDINRANMVAFGTVHPFLADLYGIPHLLVPYRPPDDMLAAVRAELVRHGGTS